MSEDRLDCSGQFDHSGDNFNVEQTLPREDCNDFRQVATLYQPVGSYR